MSIEFEEDNRMLVPAMLLDERSSKRVASVMALLGCGESDAIKRIIAACRREDIIHELHPEARSDAEQRELQAQLRGRVQDGEGAGGSGDGSQQRKRSAAPGPPDGAEAGAGKAKRGQRPQGAVEQGRKVDAVKLPRRDRAPKQIVPKDAPRGAKGQSREDARVGPIKAKGVASVKKSRAMVEKVRKAVAGVTRGRRTK